MKKIKSLFYYAFQFWHVKLNFVKVGSRTRIPLKLIKPRNIFFGKQIYIGKYSHLTAGLLIDAGSCSITIEDGSPTGNFAHVYCTSNIRIRKKVLIADKVHTTDNLHSHDDINISLADQPIKRLRNVSIGDSAWNGENFSIIGASAAIQSAIGANAVVIGSIPDYYVAIGTRARIIKTYNLETKM